MGLRPRELNLGRFFSAAGIHNAAKLLSVAFAMFFVLIQNQDAAAIGCAPYTPVPHDGCSVTISGPFPINPGSAGCPGLIKTVETLDSLPCRPNSKFRSTLHTEVYYEYVDTINWSANVYMGTWSETCTNTSPYTYEDCNDTSAEPFPLTTTNEYICVAAKWWLDQCCANKDADGDGYHDDYGYDCTTGEGTLPLPDSDDGKNGGLASCN